MITKQKPLTIYDIKNRTVATSPYFFSRKTLKFFGQTLKMFRVQKLTETTYQISAGMFDFNGKFMGQTIRIFDTVSNALTMEK